MESYLSQFPKLGQQQEDDEGCGCLGDISAFASLHGATTTSPMEIFVSARRAGFLRSVSSSPSSSASSSALSFSGGAPMFQCDAGNPLDLQGRGPLPGCPSTGLFELLPVNSSADSSFSMTMTMSQSFTFTTGRGGGGEPSPLIDDDDDGEWDVPDDEVASFLQRFSSATVDKVQPPEDLGGAARLCPTKAM